MVEVGSPATIRCFWIAQSIFPYLWSGASISCNSLNIFGFIRFNRNASRPVSLSIRAFISRSRSINQGLSVLKFRSSWPCSYRLSSAIVVCRHPLRGPLSQASKKEFTGIWLRIGTCARVLLPEFVGEIVLKIDAWSSLSWRKISAAWLG